MQTRTYTESVPGWRLRIKEAWGDDFDRDITPHLCPINTVLAIITVQCQCDTDDPGKYVLESTLHAYSDIGGLREPDESPTACIERTTEEAKASLQAIATAAGVELRLDSMCITVAENPLPQWYDYAPSIVARYAELRRARHALLDNPTACNALANA